MNEFNKKKKQHKHITEIRQISYKMKNIENKCTIARAIRFACATASLSH